ncbi:MAG TPA: putative PEP-binding protein, partial [Roseiflexaceae bacterium]|nr:putative PEP-binding protein [Roseiflexaceae bacterium]
RQAARQAHSNSIRGRLADGRHIALLANIASIADAQAAQQFGAEGVGLVRTELLFYGDDGRRRTPPSEAEHLAFYRAIIAQMPGLPITVRTADIGGDKPVAYLSEAAEANPFLGMRGIRWCMQHPDMLHAQLRALLQAAVHGDVRVMVPMVATPDDMAWARRAVQQAQASLEAEQAQFRADVPLGAMIETPAAAVTVDLLAEQADFFSIGTNDLAQYTLAADRGMTALAQQYRQNDVSVMRLVAIAARAAQRVARPISVCGDLAGVPQAAELLVGLGITTLSMAAPLIPAVKAHLAGRTLAEARLAAAAAGVSD